MSFDISHGKNVSKIKRFLYEFIGQVLNFILFTLYQILVTLVKDVILILRLSDHGNGHALGCQVKIQIRLKMLRDL